MLVLYEGFNEARDGSFRVEAESIAELPPG